MTPTEYAQEELSVWERALEEQRAAERELQQARTARAATRVRELLPQVHALATRADLLLAQAVRVKCTFRDNEIYGAPVVEERPPGAGSD